MGEPRRFERLHRVWEGIKLILWPILCDRGCFYEHDEKMVDQGDGSSIKMYYHTVVVWDAEA